MKEHRLSKMTYSRKCHTPFFCATNSSHEPVGGGYYERSRGKTEAYIVDLFLL